MMFVNQAIRLKDGRRLNPGEHYRRRLPRHGRREYGRDLAAFDDRKRRLRNSSLSVFEKYGQATRTRNYSCRPLPAETSYPAYRTHRRIWCLLELSGLNDTCDRRPPQKYTVMRASHRGLELAAQSNRCCGNATRFCGKYAPQFYIFLLSGGQQCASVCQER